MGNEKKEYASKVRPLVVIPGGPGLPHNYLETIEAVAKTDRRILEIDPLGTGQSGAFSEPIATIASPKSLASQISAAVSAAGIEEHHVFAHGTGCAAALLYAAGRKDVASLTLASPIFGLPPGAEAEPAFPWNDLGVTKRTLGPVCLDEAIQAGNRAIYEKWNPATEDELATAASAVKRGLPTLLTSGGRDLRAVATSLDTARALLGDISRSAPEASGPNKEGASGPFLPGCKGSVAEVVFKRSGHNPHLDEKEDYLLGLFGFLDAADSTAK